MEKSPRGSWRKQSIKFAKERSRGSRIKAHVHAMGIVVEMSDEHPKDSKAKARNVIRGYQHPEMTDLTVSSLTLSRLGKKLAIQWAALNRAQLERADTKCALVQGDGQEVQESEPAYAKGLDEIACAMKIPLESALKMATAVCGHGRHHAVGGSLWIDS